MFISVNITSLEKYQQDINKKKKVITYENNLMF